MVETNQQAELNAILKSLDNDPLLWNILLERYQPNEPFNSIPGTILKANQTHYCEL